MLYINKELPRHPEYLLPWNGVAASCSMKSKQPLLVISLHLLVTKQRGGEDLGSGKGLVLCSPHFSLEGKKMEILLVSTCLTCPGSSMAFDAVSLSVYCDNHLPSSLHASEPEIPSHESVFLSPICPEGPVFTAVDLGFVRGFFKFMR